MTRGREALELSSFPLRDPLYERVVSRCIDVDIDRFEERVYLYIFLGIKEKESVK